MQIYWNKRLISLFISILCCLGLHAQPHYYISDIAITGNKTTKERIILRELQFHKGDSVLVSRLPHVINRCKENLDNLRLFIYTDVDYKMVPNSDSLIVIHINVEERWYYIPLFEPKLEDRNTSTWLKDFDMSRTSLKLGANIHNMFGLNHTLTVGFKIGFQQSLNLSYKNITLDRAQKHFIAVGISAQRSHHIDVMTVEDAPSRIKDLDRILYQSVNGYLDYTYRYNVRITHHLNFDFNHISIADTVLLTNPIFWGNDHTKRLNLSLEYYLRHDQRDYAAFPLKGYYLKTSGRVFTTSDFSVRHLQLYANAQYYWDLGNRWFATERMTAGISMKNTKAYILDQALGYGENELRGYDYHVIDGQHFIALNSTIRYNIMPTKVVVINWLSWLSKFNKPHFTFYAHTFFDMGAVYHSYPSPSNTLSNQLLFSGGFGVDLVTYYDIVLSLNYSLNKQKEQGFYFSLHYPLK